MFWDKSNFNRHHAQHHRGLPFSFECNVLYKTESKDEKAGGEGMTCEFDWKLKPLASIVSETDAVATAGLLERETKILSRGASLYADEKYAEVGSPPVTMRNESEALIDAIDDFVPLSSTTVRSQVMRSKNNMLKAVPFQPLKDSSGANYAMTLSRFFVFAKIWFEHLELSEEPSLKVLVEKATMEVCGAQNHCCLEGFLLCLSQNAPHHKSADALQHAAMHMRRVLRGVALMRMCVQDYSGSDVELFCEEYLNPKRAAPFGILTTLYYEIKRCVVADRRLLIQRADPDAGFPNGSAVLIDTGQALKRVTWKMMRSVVESTIEAIESSLDEMKVPGKDIDLSSIRDVEDPAIGAGILSQNGHMFNDQAQVEWLKSHASSFNAGRLLFQQLQKAGQDFLAGIGANVGGGSRRMPELCCITLEVTAHNPVRNFRMFEHEGLLVGDYRKNQGQLLNPSQDLNFWVLPLPAARLLCRLIIFGKPLEVRLAQQFITDDAAVVHRTLLGACNGSPLKSTKLGSLTNAALFAHDCPGVHDMRHVREHFSTELMIQHVENVNPNQRANVIQSHLFEIAAVASNHSAKTSKEVYAGVFEKNSVGGIRKIELREKLAFSRMFNSIILGFGCKNETLKGSDTGASSASTALLLCHGTPSREMQSQVSASNLSSSAFLSQDTPILTMQSQLSASKTGCTNHKEKAQQQVLVPLFDSRSRGLNVGSIYQNPEHQPCLDSSTIQFIRDRLNISDLRPLQISALNLLLNAEERDTKFIQAPTGVGKDLLPFAMAVVTHKAQLIFVPFVPLIENVLIEGKKFGCKVVKFSDIHTTISVETAAATADCIVMSYEHSGKVARIAQELSMRKRLGE